MDGLKTWDQMVSGLVSSQRRITALNADLTDARADSCLLYNEAGEFCHCLTNSETIVTDRDEWPRALETVHKFKDVFVPISEFSTLLRQKETETEREGEKEGLQELC